MKKLIGFIVILFTVVSATAFLFYKNTTSPFKVKIAIMDWPGFYPAVAAAKLGYFKKHGVDVELIFCRDNPEMNSKLIEGSANFSFGVLTDHLMMVDSGVPLKFIMVTDVSLSDTLVGKPNIKNIKGLKGKKIGIGEINSFSDFFVLNLLEKSGLKETDVSFKIVPFNEITAALESGAIDAGHTWDPELSKALTKGYKVLDTAASIPGVITDGLAYRSDLVSNDEIVKAVILGIKDGIDLYRNNVELYSEAVAPFFGFTSKLSLEVINSSTPPLDASHNLNAFTENNQEGSLKQVIDKASAFYFRRGQIRGPVTTKMILDPRFVNSLRSELLK